jgi:hypothetical protein
MSEESGQSASNGGDALPPITKGRVLLLMSAMTVLVSVAGLLAVDGSFAAGVMLGGAIALVNYLWLSRTMKSMFGAAVAGQPVGSRSARFFFRYLVLGALLLLIYRSGAFPMIAVLLGLSSFAGAIVIEGLVRAFGGFFSDKEGR